MTKKEAIKLLGGQSAAAKAIGITRQAVGQWPKILSTRIADRVEAVLFRKLNENVTRSA
jgi:DNA-binding transcriptional regulator YdaS (Cro superfamily)